MNIYLSKNEIRVLKETFKSQLDMERDALSYLPQEQHDHLRANIKAWLSLKRKIGKNGKKTTAR